MTNNSKLEAFSTKAIEGFVQSVVFVDDKIYDSHSTPKKPGTQIITPKTRKPATKKAIKSDYLNQVSKSVAESYVEYSPYDIQASFAKKSIVCSLHQPEKTHSFGIDSIAYKLCSAADITIIDWDFNGDAGDKAKVLIESVIAESVQRSPHQLRLILVYTDSPNLFAIADEVYDRLSKKIPDEKIDYKKPDKGLAFYTMNARVVVLGKPGNRLNDYKEFEVAEKDLADRAIYEFRKLADGLLQGSVLLGLAAIRKNSLKILTKFHSGLDAAFLTHRALGIPHEEAFEHINPLLVDEIEAVLEDCLPKPVMDDSIIKSWCVDSWKPTNLVDEFIPECINHRDFVEDFCTKGMKFAGKYLSVDEVEFNKTVKTLKKNPPQWPSADSPSFKRLTSLLSKTSVGEDHQEFSILMSQRTCYGKDRALTQGTIIRECDKPNRFFLCLQPSCDSVRLGVQSAFIFCLLQITKGEKATHVVRFNDENIALSYKPKMANAATIVFKPSRNGVVKVSNSVFSEFDGKKRTFFWVAQLKPKHAQRASEQFARELSRVGLIESEWLRLKAK